MSIGFTELLIKSQPDKSKLFQGTLLALDPGETTGWSVFKCDGYEVTRGDSGQISCVPLEQGIQDITKLLYTWKPGFVVYEDYKVYAWKAQSHSWGELHTPQLIGAIRMRCSDLKLPVKTQMAQHAKQFMTDDKLRAWGFYQKGMKHARDSIRHGLFFLLFTYPNKPTLILPK